MNISANPAGTDLHAMLVEMSDEAIVIHCNDRIEMANEAAALLLGAKSAEALRAQLADALFPVQAGASATRQVAAYPRRRRVLQTLTRLDGAPLDVLLSERACVYQGKPATQLVFSLPSPALSAEAAPPPRKTGVMWSACHTLPSTGRSQSRRAAVCPPGTVKSTEKHWRRTSSRELMI